MELRSPPTDSQAAEGPQSHNRQEPDSPNNLNEPGSRTSPNPHPRPQDKSPVPLTLDPGLLMV